MKLRILLSIQPQPLHYCCVEEYLTHILTSTVEQKVTCKPRLTLIPSSTVVQRRAQLASYLPLIQLQRVGYHPSYDLHWSRGSYKCDFNHLNHNPKNLMRMWDGLFLMLVNQALVLKNSYHQSLDGWSVIGSVSKKKRKSWFSQSNHQIIETHTLQKLFFFFQFFLMYPNQDEFSFRIDYIEEFLSTLQKFIRWNV